MVYSPKTTVIQNYVIIEKTNFSSKQIFHKAINGSWCPNNKPMSYNTISHSILLYDWSKHLYADGVSFPSRHATCHKRTPIFPAILAQVPTPSLPTNNYTDPKNTTNPWNTCQRPPTTDNDYPRYPRIEWPSTTVYWIIFLLQSRSITCRNKWSSNVLYNNPSFEQEHEKITWFVRWVDCIDWSKWLTISCS